jgi:hypothetical protein
MSKSLAAQLIGLLSALACNLAHSGTVEQAIILADPQMQVKDGFIQGCGYRLKSIPKQLGPKSTVILDSSFNLYSSGISLLKGGALEVVVKNGAPDGMGINKRIQSFWLKVQSEKATVPIGGKVIPAETKGYLLYGTSLNEVIQLFEAVRLKTPITIGMRLHGEGLDRIYTGTVEMSEQDGAEGNRCLAELLKLMTGSQENEAK